MHASQYVPSFVRRYVRRTPWFNWAFSFVLPLYRILAVRSDTAVAIEGYPRCANTFAYVAFETSQPQPLSIAHHLHSLGQVRRAVRRGIPTLVLKRDPVDCVASYAIRKGDDRIDLLLLDYIEFYEGVVDLLDQVVVADFDEVTADFGLVIRRVNERFATSFVEFQHTPENVEACYARIDEIEGIHQRGKELRPTHVARPSDERRQKREAILSQFEAPAIKNLLSRAQVAYQRLDELRAERGETGHGNGRT